MWWTVNGIFICSSTSGYCFNRIWKSCCEASHEKWNLKFYCRYVDDTLVLIKEDQIDKILKTFNSFHNNLWFTVDKFENEDVRFLDLRIVNNGEINIYAKDTNSGLYINYNSYEPWQTKTAWIRALFDRAPKICNNNNQFHK